MNFGRGECNKNKNAKVEDFFDLRKLTDILLGNHPNLLSLHDLT